MKPVIVEGKVYHAVPEIYSCNGCAGYPNHEHIELCAKLPATCGPDKMIFIDPDNCTEYIAARLLKKK